MSTSSAIDERRLLALWEVAVSASAAAPWQRDGALLRGAGCAEQQRLGARNAELLALRSRLFGEHWPLRSTCPRCGTAAEFGVDASQLAPASPMLDHDRLQLPGGREVTVRAPELDDLRAAAAAGDTAAAEDELLRRCVTANADAAQPLDAAAREAIAARMEALDPAATLGFTIACPQCSAAWHAPLDVGAVLCTELRAHAEQVLLDVDALARAYGWSEPEVLALSPARRAAYLQLALA